jgi:hypothetical protein
MVFHLGKAKGIIYVSCMWLVGKNLISMSLLAVGCIQILLGLAGM